MGVLNARVGGAWVQVTQGGLLLPGGSAGQVLVKNSAADADASWSSTIPGYQPSTWTAMGLINGWVNYDTSLYPGAAYRKIGDMVYLRGLIKNGPINSACATLPVGFRPVTGSHHFAVPSNNLFGSVRVQNDGGVVPNVGSNAYLALDGVAFSVSV